MITHIDHINIETDDLEATIAFYTGVLGMTAGPKPSGSPGAWLFVGDRAVVHVNLVDSRNDAAPANLNHVAFSTNDLQPILGALESAGIPHQVIDRPDLAMTQVFCADPNGIPLELNVVIGEQEED